MKKIKDFKLKLIITVAVLVFALVMYIFKVPCIILSLTGVRCLGCGMTRALISVLRLDFKAAFSYHSMFWSMPILYLLFLKDGKIFDKKIYNIIILAIIIMGFVNNWLFCTIS